MALILDPRHTKGWKVIICIKTTPYVNEANFDKNGLDVFLYIPWSPNHIKKLESIGLNVLKLKLKPKNLAIFGSLEVKNCLKMGSI